MTTDPHDEHGEILRRALNAEAESVNPADDGLERIRARIADDRSRRFGRFGLARFGLGFDRFTVNWARPVLAVAAAVAIAGLGATAPQTIDLIQQSVGNNKPSAGGPGDTGGERTNAGQDPNTPAPASPGGDASGEPSTPQEPSSSSSQGVAACTLPGPGGQPTIAAPPHARTPTSTPSPSDQPTAASCPSGSPSETPTAEPSPSRQRQRCGGSS